MKPNSSETTLIAVIARALDRLLPRIDPAAENLLFLKRRNRWLDLVSQLLGGAGLLAGLALPLAVRGQPLRVSMADLGVAISLGFAFPSIFLLLLAVMKGKPRLLEFLAFHSLKYGVDARNLLLFICIPAILIGLGCAWLSYFR